MSLLYNNSKSGVYIHVPFCRRRCSYCDFYFEIGRSRANFERYIQQEWDFRKDSWPFEPQTLYFGGGTPSLLVPEQIGALIRILAPNAREITLEANPEDLNPEYLKQIRQLGVNRLSLGIQSFEDPILTYLGRNHSSKQAKECISQAQEAGFKRISVDIIAGVPGENLEPGFEWLHEQKIGHISSYLLTVEPNTPLVKLIQKKRRQEPQHDFQADAYGQVQNQLKILGYEQYEVSSYALPGQESQHNRVYWSQGIYLGLGPGAHSMMLNSDGSVTRRHTTAKLGEWQVDPKKAPFEEEQLSPKEALLEALAFGLRDLKRGINPSDLAKRHQSPIPTGFEDLMSRFENSGWIRHSHPGEGQGPDAGLRWHDKYIVTPKGAAFLDAIAREILSLLS